MRGVNKAIIVGNLGKDPEVRYTTSGTPVARFSVATTDSWTDKESHDKKEKTEWHNIVVWGKQGEHCGEYLKKGRQVYIEGRIQTRNYDDKEGNKRYITEIVANTVQFLGGGGARAEGFAPAAVASGGMEAESSPPQSQPAVPFDSDDDIPF